MYSYILEIPSPSLASPAAFACRLSPAAYASLSRRLRLPPRLPQHGPDRRTVSP